MKEDLIVYCQRKPHAIIREDTSWPSMREVFKVFYNRKEKTSMREDFRIFCERGPQIS